MSARRTRNGLMGIVAAALLLGLALPAGAARPAPSPLVDNGGFESGLVGWDISSSTCVQANSTAHTGSTSAILSCYGAANSLSQKLKTRSGVSYTVDFWLAGGYNNSPAATQPVIFHATVAPARTPSATTSVHDDPDGNDSGEFSWQRITNTFTATSSSTVLTFTAHTESGFYFLDDVSVTKTA